MIRQSVTSKHIKSIGYADDVLEIEFSNGSVYQYHGEPAREHFDNLIQAESKGKYFGKFLRRAKQLKTYKVNDASPES